MPVRETIGGAPDLVPGVDLGGDEVSAAVSHVIGPRELPHDRCDAPVVVEAIHDRPREALARAYRGAARSIGPVVDHEEVPIVKLEHGMRLVELVEVALEGEVGSDFVVRAERPFESRAVASQRPNRVQVARGDDKVVVAPDRDGTNVVELDRRATPVASALHADVVPRRRLKEMPRRHRQKVAHVVERAHRSRLVALRVIPRDEHGVGEGVDVLGERLVRSHLDGGVHIRRHLGLVHRREHLEVRRTVIDAALVRELVEVEWAVGAASDVLVDQDAVWRDLLQLRVRDVYFAVGLLAVERQRPFLVRGQRAATAVASRDKNNGVVGEEVPSLEHAQRVHPDDPALGVDRDQALEPLPRLVARDVRRVHGECAHLKARGVAAHGDVRALVEPSPAGRVRAKRAA
mmetsp:Transcript_6236/g.18903  ORF Transcript_6236/g.18903 Transcript_6236/m.18903 type:complete len:404 (-) Transcript_6236:488-1699(-)